LYLKRLEVQGFKSLADKIELQFNPGITAVVGPNGSGKSNIADAVRWVLGEQSVKSLRGAKMEDVIFSGSDRRKAVGMAEVALTLDNSGSVFPLDYSEITVARRVYRNGESEFLINKSPCRLRDIHELFMDTGIGREGYSIIGQGKIDEILSAKSEDRRTIIEEAAGIIKYKTRKLQAAKKLVDTEQNLVRISDIINELEIRVEPLAEQSAKAREYLGFREELVDLEVNLLVNQIADQKQKLAEINEKDEGLQRNLIESETMYRNLESEAEEQKLQTNKLDEEITNLQKELYGVSGRIEKEEAQIMVAGERLKDLEAQKEEVHQEISELQNKETIERTQHSDDEQAFTEVKEKIKAEEKRLAEIEQRLSDTEAKLLAEQKQIEEQKGEIIDLLNEMAGVKNSINSGEIEKHNILRRTAQLQAQIEALDVEHTAVDNKEKELRERIGESDYTISKLTADEKLLAEKRDNLDGQLKALAGQLAEARELLRNKSSRLKALQDLQDDYEGYHRGVKEVLIESKKGNACPGLCGVVAEVIRVPEKYETAIEVALGSALQFIITENDINARDAIQFLKKNKAGRATFLPLNSIKPSQKQDEIKKIAENKGFLGRAAEFISCADKYSDVVEYLLGKVAITENINHAIELARLTNHNIKIVTLDGDVVNPGGSITGGVYQRGRASLLGRIREIEEAAADSVRLEREVKVLDNNMSKAQTDFNRYLTQIAGIQAQLQDLLIEKNSLQKDADIVLQEKERLSGTKKYMAEELQNLNDQAASSETITISRKKNLKELELKDVEIRRSIEDRQGQLTGLEKERSSLTDTATQTKVSLAGLKQEEINYTQIMNRVIEEIKEIKAQIQRKEKQVKDCHAQQELMQTDIKQHEQEVRRLNQQKGSLEDTLNDMRNEKQSLAAGVAEKESRAKTLTREMGQVKEQLHAADIKRARFGFEVENSLAKLAEEFEITYEEALLKKTEIKSKREVSARVKELKEAIAVLGNVNIGSIEEYTRVKERYDFLSGQYHDLDEAKKSLYKVIAEMDQIMMKKFRDTFNEINSNFGLVFAKLFDGGKAELILTNTDNILESGIDILAQPPGKKNQHLSLLSGGERALTAISLLFAILKTKPIPFCVLDEIESSLDEANVDRFANYLKEYVLDTQFIVITHQKGTMEAANVLYGVTMDDSSVTKMVSMKLSDAMDKVS